MFGRVFLAAIVLLAACGGDDDDDEASGGPPREGTSAEWAAVQDFADEVGCVLPLQPVEPTPISCAAG